MPEAEPGVTERSAGPGAERERQLQRAFELAYPHLNRRDRTVVEMRRHLEAREIEPAAIDQALSTLIEDGYLDDARYARLFAEDKRALEQWGTERIRRELLQRGIDRDLIGSALAAGETESELERALALLRHRFPAPCSDRRERDRALGMMLRKGYDSEVALEALAAHARSD